MPHDQKLNEAQRDQIVVRLAAFEAPMEICRSLQRELGITITRQYICRLDPTRNPRCPEKRRRRFFAVREAILREKGEADAEHAMRGRSRERKVLRAVRLLADQFLDVVAREMRATLARRPDISDSHRARALSAFIKKVNSADDKGGGALSGGQP
jgi:hypothetical protein